MDTQPEEITECQLNCVVMSQGEIICAGKTLGWFDELKNYLTPATSPSPLIRELLQDAHGEHACTILDKMDKYGGSFVKQLSTLYRHGDQGNKKLILSTWPHLFKQYDDGFNETPVSHSA